VLSRGREALSGETEPPAGVCHSGEDDAASVTSCALTPDGRRMGSASHDRTLLVWDLVTGPVLPLLKATPTG
jgi:hypothetical protein